MLNLPLFARVYLSIDLDRAHSHMRSWCGTTMCVAGRCIQLIRPDLDLRAMSSDDLGRRLAGRRISDYDTRIIIREKAAKGLGITNAQAESLFYPDTWCRFWPDCDITDWEQTNAPAMLTAIEKFIENYYPDQMAPFRREVERLRAGVVHESLTTECVEA